MIHSARTEEFSEHGPTPVFILRTGSCVIYFPISRRTGGLM